MKIICPYCNYSREVDPAAIPAQAERATCPRCHQKFEFSSETFAFEEQAAPVEEMEPERGAPAVMPDVEEAGQAAASWINIPWESRQGGFFADLLITARMVLFQPGEFFARMPIRGGIMSPLVFAVLVGSIGLCFSIFWPLLWGLTRGGSGLEEWIPLMFGSSMSDLGPLSSFRLGQVFILLASVPFMVVIGLFIYSLFTHFLLILVWGNKSGFEATFRVLSYVMAGYIFNIVPIIGGLVSGIWMIVLQVIGLSQAHGIGVLRVLFAVLFLPFIFLLLIAVAFIGLLGLIPLLLWG